MEKITPELAIAQFEGHLIKAEIVPEINITELHALAEKAKALVEIDINDDSQMKEVAVVRKELVTARRKIEADGKSARDEHTRVNKAILQVQNVLVGILEEDENRLKEFERQRKEKDIKEERLKTLPQRKQLLSTIKDSVEISDDEILSMDDATFLNYFTERQLCKAEADKWAEEAKQAEEHRKAEEVNRIKQAEENARIEVEQKVKAEAEALAKEAEVKAQAEINAKEAEIARMKKEQADREAEVKRQELLEIEKVQAEAKVKAEMEAQQKYQDWLKNNNYNPNTDVIQDTGLDIVMYRKVAVYSKEI